MPAASFERPQTIHDGRSMSGVAAPPWTAPVPQSDAGRRALAQLPARPPERAPVFVAMHTGALHASRVPLEGTLPEFDRRAAAPPKHDGPLVPTGGVSWPETAPHRTGRMSRAGLACRSEAKRSGLRTFPPRPPHASARRGFNAAVVPTCADLADRVPTAEVCTRPRASVRSRGSA